jgi:hypothetical protein
MKFPTANVSLKEWNPNEDYLLYVLMDPYYCIASNEFYRKYYHNQRYVDSNGDIFMATDKKLPKSIFRNIFRFIPGVYKVELIFTSTGEKMELEEVREFLLKQVNKLKGDNVSEWINQIKKSKSIQEVLGG